MYSKPELEKFGNFRQLTQIGFSGSSDGFTIVGPPTPGNPSGNGNGCNLADPLGLGCGGGATAS